MLSQMADLTKSLTILAKPFFDQGVEKLHVTLHCNRLFVGRFPAQKCRVCGGKPEHQEMTSLDQAAEIVRSLR
jgi:hypothetical protein